VARRPAGVAVDGRLRLRGHLAALNAGILQTGTAGCAHKTPRASAMSVSEMMPAHRALQAGGARRMEEAWRQNSILQHALLVAPHSLHTLRTQHLTHAPRATRYTARTRSGGISTGQKKKKRNRLAKEGKRQRRRNAFRRAGWDTVVDAGAG